MTTPEQPAAAPPDPRKRTVSRYQPGFDKVAHDLAFIGASQADIAHHFGVNLNTITNWKKAHPSFEKALTDGKRTADGNVARALYWRAVGYSHEDSHISNYKGEITITKVIKHYPPDPKAAEIWLYNRRPDQWKRDPGPMAGDGALGTQLAELIARLPG